MAQLPSPALSLGHAAKFKGKMKATSKSSEKTKGVPEAVTLEIFVSQMLPLIDLEKVVFG